MHTARQIDDLGDRLRAKSSLEDDFRLLEEARGEYDAALFATNNWVCKAMELAKTGYVCAGRSKRTKSIVRKLGRPENKNMPLSKMVDMVGLRVVVRDLAAQTKAVDAISLTMERKNYLDDGKLYRAIHLIDTEDKGFKPIEIQVRTLPQQIWANESESFGEGVKEGGGPEDIRNYLSKLSAICRDLDNNKAIPTEQDLSGYFESRATLSLRIPHLQKTFDEVVSDHNPGESAATFIVVYDNETNICTRKDRYETGERYRALSDYRALIQTVDQARYETLILNSSSDAALRVTHPRFFPEEA